jgi:hypothetical protein
MRRYKALSVALALSGMVYSGSAWAAFPACAVGVATHNHARIVLKGKTIAKCDASSLGCKCVSCYNLDGSVYSACYPLWVTGIPHT